MPPKHGHHEGGEHERRGEHEGQQGGGGGGGGGNQDMHEKWKRDQEAYRNASDPQEKQRLKEELRKDREALGYPTDDHEDEHGGRGGEHEGKHGGGHGEGHHGRKERD